MSFPLPGVGAVCAGTRFEGMVHGSVRRDGWQARPGAEARDARTRRAIHRHGPFVYQVHGAEPHEIAHALTRLTDTGNVPEALRLAHLIGGALACGESGRRA